MEVMSLFNLYYLVSTTILTYLILLLCVNTQKRWVKIAISLISGAIIGGIFYHFKIITVDVLITSFLGSIVSYEWIIKQLLDKFNLGTNNEIGIKL